MSSPQPTSLFWFALLDSDGHPLKGTPVSSIPLFSSTVVVQFREAAHLKNASILTGIDSSQLKVYKNKLAFDGKEEPLGLHSVVDDLGASKDDALVVVVPISAAPWKLFGQKGRTAVFPAPGAVLEMEPSLESRIKEQPFISMPPRTPFSAARAGCLVAHSLTLADGRNLEYYLDGVLAKPAVFLVHGQFSTGRMWIGSERNDLFLVMPTRPNYGGSSHHAGYTYSTFANDLQQLAGPPSSKTIPCDWSFLWCPSGSDGQSSASGSCWKVHSNIHAHGE